MSKTKEWLMDMQEKDEHIASQMTFKEYLKELHAKEYSNIDFDEFLDAMYPEIVIDFAEKFVALVRSKIDGLTEEYNPN